MPKFNKNTLRTISYIILIILPSIFTDIFYNGFTSQKLFSSSNASIKALGTSLYNQLEQLTSSISYTLDLMTNSDDFETLNISSISQSISLFTYYNPDACSNIYIVHKDLKPIYSVDNNAFLGITYNDHIKMALGGSPQTYYTAPPSPFAQLTFPILNYNNPNEVIAILVATIDMDLSTQALIGLPDIDSNFKGYVVGESGGIIASSLPPTSIVPTNIDIEDIRISLKYSKDQTFTDYNGEVMYGTVFSLPSIHSYLLLTTPASNTAANYLDYISYIFGLLGAGTITTSEAIRKKRSLSTTSLSPTESSLSENNTITSPTSVEVSADLDVYQDNNPSGNSYK